MTMNLSASEQKELVISAQDYAKAMGTTTDNVLEAMKVYSNMNETMDSIIKKSQAAVVMANLSGMSMKESSDIVQGLAEQFNVADDNAMKINDTIMRVAAGLKVNFQDAISGIGDAVKAMGSAANEAGLSLERTESIVGTIIEKTRIEGSTAGAAIKSIMARIGAAKDEGTTDEDISKAETAFESVGIQIRKSATEFKSMEDILGELSTKWSGLSSVTKDYISNAAAATRQGNIFRAMMDGWKQSTDLTTAAMNSQGFAIEKQQIYIQSTAAKINQLKDTFTTLWQKTLDSSVINGLVSALTSFLGLFNNWGNLITIITGLIITFNYKAIAGFISGIGESIAGLFAFTAAAEGATVAVTAFQRAMGLIGIAISLVGVAVTVFMDLNKQTNKASDEMQQLSQQTDEFNSQIGQLTDKYKQLFDAAKTDNNTKIQLIETESQLTKALGLSTGAIDSQNKSLDENIKVINEASKSKLQTIIASQLGAYNDAKKYLAGDNSSGLNWKPEQELQNLQQRTIEEYNANGNSKDYQDDIKLLNDLQKKIEDAKNVINEFDAAQKRLDETTQATNTTIANQAGEFIHASTDSKQFTTDLTQLESDAKELGKSIDTLNKGQELNAQDIAKLIEDYPELQDKVKQNAQGYYIEKSALVDLRNTHIDAINERLKKDSGLTDEMQNNLLDRMKAYGLEASALQDLASAQAAIAKLPTTAQVAASGGTGEHLDELISATNASGLASDMLYVAGINDKINKLSGLMSEPDFGVTTPKGSSSTSSGLSETSAATAEIKDRYALLNQALNQNNSLLEKNKSLQDIADYKTKLGLMDQEIGLLKQQQNLKHQMAEEERKERDEDVSKLKGYGLNFTGTGDNQSITNYDAVITAKMNQVNAHTGDKNKTVYNQLKAQYDDLLKISQRFFDIQDKDIPGLQKDWETLAKSINDVNLSKVTLKFDEIDKSQKATTESLKQLDYQYKALGDKDYAGKMDILDKKISETKKSIDDDNKAIQDLNNNTDPAIKATDTFKDKMQALNDSVQDATLSVSDLDLQKMTLAFDAVDKKQQATAESLKQLGYGYKALDDKDYVGKISNLGDQIFETQKGIDADNKSIEDLTDSTDAAAQATVAFQDKMQALKDSVKEATLSIADLKNQQEQQVEAAYKDVEATQKKADQLQLTNDENAAKKNIQDLQKLIYNVSESEYNAYKANVIAQLKAQGSSQAAINILENQSYDTLVNFKDVYTDIANAKIKDLQTQQKQLDLQSQYLTQEQKIADLQDLKTTILNYNELAFQGQKITKYDEEINALENINNLTQSQIDDLKQQIDLEIQKQNVFNAQNEKNVQIYHAGIGFVWEANPKTVADEQQKLADMQVSYANFQKDTADKMNKEILQSQIDSEQQLLQDRNDAFDRQQNLINNQLQQEKDDFTTFYETLDNTTANQLDNLNITLGNKWQTILDTIKTKVDAVVTEMNKINTPPSTTIGTAVSIGATSNGQLWRMPDGTLMNGNTPVDNTAATTSQNLYKSGDTLRQFAERSGLTVGYDAATKTPSINGKPINPAQLGMSLVNGSWTGTKSQYDAAIKAAGFANEGYTGTWSDGSGKLIKVHPEEFILNKSTVASMLTGNLQKILPSVPNMGSMIKNETNTNQSNSNTTVINIDTVKTNDYRSFIEASKRQFRSS